jgi:Rrf2 family protein
VELNTKGRYAVMAMADVAKNGTSGAVPISAVAERQRLSISYLEQIFLQLRRAGLVESERGRSGGYRLKRPCRDITVAEIMRAVDEGTRMTRCREGVPGGCAGDQPCITHELWHSLSAHIESFLAAVSLEDVINGIPPEKRVRRPGASRVLAAE